DLYREYGFYKEALISITKKGMNGAREIADMMEEFRTNPPQQIAGSKVVQILDYQKREGKNLNDGSIFPIHIPKSNVLQFVLEDGAKISARPSGTEPKIKFYFSVNTSLTNVSEFEKTEAILNERINNIINDMKLNAS